MASIVFEWDEGKNRENRRKHGVTFEEARSVFFDEEAVEFEDVEHSDVEERFLMLGRSARLRIVLVSYCLRNEGSTIRIVSARKATKNEREFYPRGKP